MSRSGHGPSAAGRLRPKDVAKVKSNPPAPTQTAPQAESVGPSQILRQLLDSTAPPAKRLSLIHQLNGWLLEAPTLEECEKRAAQLPESVFPIVFELVSSGEPHVYIALNLLHYAAFHPPLTVALQRLKVVPFLCGLLRAGAGAEHELARAALSLLVTLSQPAAAEQQLGQTRSLPGIVSSFLGHAAAEMRQLAASLLQAVLGSPGGRRNACGSERLAEALAQAVQAARDADERKRLGSLERELQFYRLRAAGPGQQQPNPFRK